MAFRFAHPKKLLLALTVIAVVTTVRLIQRMMEEPEVLPVAESLLNSTLGYETDDKKEFLKIFHLDLKGGPPKLSYLFNLLPVVKKAGGNAILIEYEDMFPFSGALRNVSAENAYTPKEVEQLVTFAESLDMDVIPLVQTFGHLEYVLKLQEFQDLRELGSFPQEICPLNRKAVDLVKEMVSQVMAAHRSSKYVHVGCDEVRHVGACSRCSRANPKKIFAKHVRTVARHVRSQRPDSTPLIWDDMLRSWTYDDLVGSDLRFAVEPVVWVYGNNINNLVPPLVWNLYGTIFPKVWVASSFKGAFGETEILPPLVRHLDNNLSWMKMLTGEEEVGSVPITVGGVFVTGWSRYDHFAVLCELLPAGIPSLVLDLVFLGCHRQKDKLKAFSRWLRILKCPESFLQADLFAIAQEELFKYKLGNCSFPGSNLYGGMVRFEQLKARVQDLRKKVDTGGWTSRYNVERNFTSPWRILEMFPEEGFAGEFLKSEVALWKSVFLPIMSQYFDNFTVFEWEEQNVRPLEENLEEIQLTFKKLILRKTWPRRPLR